MAAWRLHLPGWIYACGVCALLLIPDAWIFQLLSSEHSSSSAQTDDEQTAAMPEMPGGNASETSYIDLSWVPHIKVNKVGISIPASFKYGYDSLCDMHSKNFRLHNLDTLKKKHHGHFHASFIASPVGMVIILWYCLKITITFVVIPTIPFPTADKWKVKYQESLEATASQQSLLPKEDVTKALERLTRHLRRQEKQPKSRLMPLNESNLRRQLVTKKRQISDYIQDMAGEDRKDKVRGFVARYHPLNESVDNLTDWFCPNGVDLSLDDLKKFQRESTTGHWLNHQETECLHDCVEFIMNRLTRSRESLWLIFQIAAGNVSMAHPMEEDNQSDVIRTESTVSEEEDELQVFMFSKYPMDDKLPLFLRLKEMLPSSNFNSSKTKRYVRSMLNFPATKGFGSVKINLPWSQQTQMIIFFAQALQTVAEIILTGLKQNPPFTRFFLQPYWWVLTFREEVNMPMIYLCIRIAMLYYPLVRMSGTPVWRPISGGPLWHLRVWPLRVLFFGLSMPVCAIFNFGEFDSMPRYVFVIFIAFTFRLLVGLSDERCVTNKHRAGTDSDEEQDVGDSDMSRVRLFRISSLVSRVITLLCMPFLSFVILTNGGIFVCWLIWSLHALWWILHRYRRTPRESVGKKWLDQLLAIVDAAGSWDLMGLVALNFLTFGTSFFSLIIWICVLVALGIYHVAVNDARACMLWETVTCETRLQVLWMIPIPLVPYVPSILLSGLEIVLAFYPVKWFLDTYKDQIPLRLRKRQEAFTQNRDYLFIIAFWMVEAVIGTKLFKLLSADTYLCTFSGIQLAPSIGHLDSPGSYLIVFFWAILAGMMFIALLSYLRSFFPWAFSETFWLSLWAFHCNDILSVALGEDAYSLVRLVKWQELDHDEHCFNNYSFRQPLMVHHKDGHKGVARFRQADGYGEFSVEEEKGIRLRYTSQLRHVGVEERARVRVPVDNTWRYGRITRVDVCSGAVGSSRHASRTRSAAVDQPSASITLSSGLLAFSTVAEATQSLAKSRVCYKVKFDDSPLQEYVDAVDLEFAALVIKTSECGWVKLDDLSLNEESSVRVLTYTTGELVRSLGHEGGSYIGKVSAIRLCERTKRGKAPNLNKVKILRLEYELSVDPQGTNKMKVSEHKMKSLFMPLKLCDDAPMLLPSDGDMVTEHEVQTVQCCSSVFSHNEKPFNTMRFQVGGVWEQLHAKIQGGTLRSRRTRFKGKVKVLPDSWVDWDEVQPGMVILSKDHKATRNKHELVKRLLKSFDLDSDHLLNRMEFEESMTYMAAAESSSDPKDLLVKVSSIGKSDKSAQDLLFYELDANHDGKLDQAELKRGFSRIETESHREAEERHTTPTASASASKVKFSPVAEAPAVEAEVKPEGPLHAGMRKEFKSGSRAIPHPHPSPDEVVLNVQGDSPEKSKPANDVVEKAVHQEVIHAKQKAEQECAQLQQQLQAMQKVASERDQLEQQVQDGQRAAQECEALRLQLQDMRSAEQENVRLRQQLQDVHMPAEETLQVQEQLQEKLKVEQECEGLRQQVQDLQVAAQESAQLREQLQEVHITVGEETTQLREAEQECERLQQQLQDLQVVAQENAQLREHLQDSRKTQQESEQLRQQVQAIQVTELECERLRQRLQEAEQKAALAEKQTEAPAPRKMPIFDTIPASSVEATAGRARYVAAAEPAASPILQMSPALAIPKVLTEPRTPTSPSVSLTRYAADAVAKASPALALPKPVPPQSPYTSLTRPIQPMASYTSSVAVGDADVSLDAGSLRVPKAASLGPTARYKSPQVFTGSAATSTAPTAATARSYTNVSPPGIRYSASRSAASGLSVPPPQIAYGQPSPPTYAANAKQMRQTSTASPTKIFI